jgi:hypothetical protein
MKKRKAPVPNISGRIDCRSVLLPARRRSEFISSTWIWITVSLITLVGHSCYHVRTVADSEAQRDPNPQQQTAWVMWWGLDQPRVLAPECRSGALQEVRTSTNLGYALITVVTLGIACPLDVEYTCAKPCDLDVPAR